MTVPDKVVSWHRNQEFADSPVTWGQLVRCSDYLMRSAIGQVHRDFELHLREADAIRQKFEDKRSVKRNRNRIYVLTMSLTLALLWPDIALHVFHDVAMTAWTTAIAAVGDILVTGWALWRHI